MLISFDFSIDFGGCKMYMFLLKKKGMKSIKSIEKNKESIRFETY